MDESEAPPVRRDVSPDRDQTLTQPASTEPRREKWAAGLRDVNAGMKAAPTFRKQVLRAPEGTASASMGLAPCANIGRQALVNHPTVARTTMNRQP